MNYIFSGFVTFVRPYSLLLACYPHTPHPWRPSSFFSCLTFPYISISSHLLVLALSSSWPSLSIHLSLILTTSFRSVQPVRFLHQCLSFPSFLPSLLLALILVLLSLPSSLTSVSHPFPSPLVSAGEALQKDTFMPGVKLLLISASRMSVFTRWMLLLCTE